ncbi:hypothetical protein BV25DRAFT_947231 [Artomyces pyxidatus]|uniref:Uncharacterized protein n=1 Tax=Artomyces pyxidatus TaxID=48021 RepID=A0ACB8SVR7_9AGAM|nr:hypothetical protein BV25DRAFT_947231 [Artomyces pyxidatus]
MLKKQKHNNGVYLSVMKHGSATFEGAAGFEPLELTADPRGQTGSRLCHVQKLQSLYESVRCCFGVGGPPALYERRGKESARLSEVWDGKSHNCNTYVAIVDAAQTFMRSLPPVSFSGESAVLTLVSAALPEQDAWPHLEHSRRIKSSTSRAQFSATVRVPSRTIQSESSLSARPSVLSSI